MNKFFGNGSCGGSCGRGYDGGCSMNSCWIIILLLLCSCNGNGFGQGCDCCTLILLILLLSCCCGQDHRDC